MQYTTGFNQPGYMPESKPYTHETREDAINAINEDIAWVLDRDEANYAFDTYDTLQLRDDDDNFWVFWITPTMEDN